MPEISLIAYDDPDSGERHHLSVMGASGNHHSVALYLGKASRQRFNLIHEADFEDIELSAEDTLSLILDTPQLQCSFSGRADLFASELASIKAANRKYRGQNWPTFRTFRPGHCPVPAKDPEIRLLLSAIEQLLEVAPTLEFGDDTLRFASGTGQPEILTRRRVDGSWQTCWTPDDNSLFEFPAPAPSDLLIHKVDRHHRRISVEVCFMLIPNPVGKSRESSLFPYILMVVEPTSHFILGVEVLSVEKMTHDQLLASVPDTVLKLCDRHAVRPESFATSSVLTAALLEPTAAALNATLDLQPCLPALEEAMESVLGAFGGGF